MDDQVHNRDSPSDVYDDPDNNNDHQNQMMDDQPLIMSERALNSLAQSNSQHDEGVEDEDEDFVPDPNMETLDLSGQYIDDLEPLIKLVFQKMPKLRELNLSNNMISSLPVEMCRNYLPVLESINLNGN